MAVFGPIGKTKSAQTCSSLCQTAPKGIAVGLHAYVEPPDCVRKCVWPMQPQTNSPDRGGQMALVGTTNPAAIRNTLPSAGIAILKTTALQQCSRQTAAK